MPIVKTMIRTLLNLIWLIFAGVELAIGYIVGGVVMMVTVIGIPFGVQAFKLAGYTLWPFGRAVVPDPDRSGVGSALGNILWLLLVGWWLAAAHFVFGLLLCLTIVGIPMGIASFKMAGLALMPFGRKIVDRSNYGQLPEGSHSIR